MSDSAEELPQRLRQAAEHSDVNRRPRLAALLRDAAGRICDLASELDEADHARFAAVEMLARAEEDAPPFDELVEALQDVQRGVRDLDEVYREFVPPHEQAPLL